MRLHFPDMMLLLTFLISLYFPYQIQILVNFNVNIVTGYEVMTIVICKIYDQKSRNREETPIKTFPNIFRLGQVCKYKFCNECLE